MQYEAIALNLINHLALALLSSSGVWHEYQEKLESRHAATEEKKCRNMENKYGWKLLWVEVTEDKSLKVNSSSTVQEVE
ncbi:MAG: hypothetical protein V7K26_30755 [Nostoc sp.]